MATTPHVVLGVVEVGDVVAVVVEVRLIVVDVRVVVVDDVEVEVVVVEVVGAWTTDQLSENTPDDDVPAALERPKQE